MNILPSAFFKFRKPMKKIVSFVLIAGWVVLSQFPAFAWNKAGHMVTGSIAYAVMKKEHPKELAKVVALLKTHPQYDALWKESLEILKPEDRDEALFMFAARWADDARPFPQFHHDKWHYVNVPFIPPGQPDSVKPPESPKESILTAFAENLAVVKNPNAKDYEKAVALCWLFHLVGDGHQPLHAATLFTTVYKEGDRGGNLFYVKAPGAPETINLHYLWDGLVQGSDKIQDARNRATELRLRPEFRKKKLKELSDRKFDHWVMVESSRLGKEVAYRNGDLKGSADKTAGVELPADYLPKAKAVAERRLVLASYRLSDVLAAAVKK